MMSPALATRRATTVHLAVGATLALVVFALTLVVGVPLLVALLVALVVAACVIALLYLRQEALVLRAVRAVPLDPGEEPRFENVVAGLCVANGFRQPALYRIDDAALNMLAVGRHPRHGALAVTSGLLDDMGRVELEGLVAHELTRIRNRTTLLDATVGSLVARPLGFVPSVAGALARRLLDPRTSAELDVAGVSVTRYPPGLAGALRSLGADGRTPRADPAAYRHLWIKPPSGAIVEQDFTIDDRIDVLEEL